RVIKTGQPFLAEDACEHIFSGKKREELLSGSVMLVPLFQKNGKITGVLIANGTYSGHNFTITDMRLFNALGQQLSMSLQKTQLFLELTESKNYIEDIIMSMSDMLITIDLEGTIKSVNNATLQALGYSEEDIIGKPVVVISDASLFEGSFIENLNKIREIQDYQTTYKKKDGFKIRVSLSASAVKTAEETIIGAVCVARDMTEHIQKEEISHKLEAEKLVVKELKDLDRLKNQFVETVTHELKTPMTPLKSVVQMFIDGTLGKLSEQQKEYIEMMGRNIDRLSQFATDVFSLSKLDSGTYELRPYEISVLSVIRPVVKLFSQKAKERNSTIILEVKTEIFAFADPNAVNEIVTNLLNNAITHCPENTEIRVSSRVLNQDFIEVIVSDNGTGIPEDMLDKIFDRFLQIARQSGPGYKGSGIGLPICKALVEQMGGKIYVESKFGKGSAFIFTLPIRQKVNR
ncbi:MAG: ATP-binding protein, partial [Planctomycetota bacterium]